MPDIQAIVSKLHLLANFHSELCNLSNKDAELLESAIDIALQHCRRVRQEEKSITWMPGGASNWPFVRTTGTDVRDTGQE